MKKELEAIGDNSRQSASSTNLMDHTRGDLKGHKQVLFASRRRKVHRVSQQAINLVYRSTYAIFM